MRPGRIAGNRLSLIIRVALLLIALSTYLVSKDDVVWHFIKNGPHARALEHLSFGIAAAILGVALLLKVKASANAQNRNLDNPCDVGAAIASALQAFGIGSLLPLPGFLLLVLGDASTSLFLCRWYPAAEDRDAERDSKPAPGTPHGLRWRNALAAHVGLCLAFLSMAVFSVVLIDRVADVLFAITALVSITAKLFR